MSEAYRLHTRGKLGLCLSVCQPRHFLRATGVESQACNASVFISVRLPTFTDDNLPSFIARQIVVLLTPRALDASLIPYASFSDGNATTGGGGGGDGGSEGSSFLNG